MMSMHFFFKTSPVFESIGCVLELLLKTSSIWLNASVKQIEQPMATKQRQKKEAMTTDTVVHPTLNATS